VSPEVQSHTDTTYTFTTCTWAQVQPQGKSTKVLRLHPWTPVAKPTYLEKLNLGKRMKFFMKMVKSSASLRSGSLENQSRTT
jgi:hypothetical protein